MYNAINEYFSFLKNQDFCDVTSGMRMVSKMTAGCFYENYNFKVDVEGTDVDVWLFWQFLMLLYYTLLSLVESLSVCVCRCFVLFPLCYHRASATAATDDDDTVMLMLRVTLTEGFPQHRLFLFTLFTFDIFISNGSCNGKRECCVCGLDKPHSNVE